MCQGDSVNTFIRDQKLNAVFLLFLTFLYTNMLASFMVEISPGFKQLLF